MIDIHTHCLPGIDDGAADVSESIKMLEESSRQGVKVCVATPHCVLHQPMGLKEFLSDRDRAWNELKAEIERTKAEVPEILLGAEVYLDHDISDFPELEKLCIGETNYMLVEFSRETITPMVPEWLYSLTVRGIKPIVAHIDRYFNWEEILNATAGTEIVCQINADNFLSFFGRRHIKRIIEYGFDYIISSDMHNMDNRVTKMAEAYKKCSRMFPALTEDMFRCNAYNILKGDI